MPADLEQAYTALRNADKAGDTEGAKRLASYIQEQSGAAAAPARTPPTKLKIGREGFGEAIRSTLAEHPVAGRLAAFGEFPRQLFEGAKQALGRPDPQAIEATKAMEETYPLSALGGGLATAALASFIPGGQSIAGQAVFGGATGALGPTEAGESRTKNALLGAGLAGGTAGVLKGVGMGTKSLLSRSATKAAGEQSEKAVTDATLAEGRAAGYVVPGSATGQRGAVRKAVESVAGKAALGQEASIRNQEVTNKIARAEAGLRPNEPITETSLASARERLSAPYREVADMSPKAAGDLDKLKGVRADAKAQWQFYNRSLDPKALKEAQALDAKADRLESAIEREAGNVAKKGLRSDYAKAAAQASGLVKGKDLVSRLRDARKALAKNYQVEKAVNLGTGNVDAAAIGRVYNKVGEKGMTGGLATIGKFQQAFPDFMRGKPTTQVGPGVGALRPYAAALGLGVGAEYGREHYGLSPYMLGAATLPLLGGPARSLALSKLAQTAPIYAPGATVRLADLTARQGSRLLPMTTAGLALQPNNQ